MSEVEAIDCEIYVADRDHALLRFEGQEFTGTPRLDEATLVELRASLEPEEYGQKLFAALLPSGQAHELEAGWRRALAISRDRQVVLRLRLHVDAKAPAELHGLRWERLVDPAERLALAASGEVAFSRYSTVPMPVPGPADGGKVLVAVADPAGLAHYGLSPLDRPAMVATLTRAFAACGFAGFEILAGPVTRGRINARLLGGRFEALHLVAHGFVAAARSAATLFLEDEAGAVDLVDEQFFVEVVRHNPRLRLVTLMACHGAAASRSEDSFSGLGASLVRVGVPAVLAMRQAVSFEAAERFTAAFYGQLAATGVADTAASQARLQLRLEMPASEEWSNPVLFMRLADGHLWAPRKVRQSQAADDDIPWRTLVDRIEQGFLLPILGPGLLAGPPGSPPVKAELATRWASEFEDFPLDERRTDLATVAQFVEVKEGRGRPHEALAGRFASLLRERVADSARTELGADLPPHRLIARLAAHLVEADPGEPHAILADLPLPAYLTTNHDPLLTLALRRQGKEVLRARYSRDETAVDLATTERYQDLAGSLEKPLVFHAFGNEEDPLGQVLTGDDYLDFVRVVSPARFPRQLELALNDSMLLFLGYDVRELDCRVLFRGLVTQLKEPRRDRVAVLQIEPNGKGSLKMKALERFIEDSCRALRIKVYWGSVRDFLLQLQAHWEARHG